MTTSSHDSLIDPRNHSILININNELFPRDKAVISVFIVALFLVTVSGKGYACIMEQSYF